MQFDLPPAFVNNINLPISSTALNQLLVAAMQLDGWSYRKAALFDGQNMGYGAHPAGDHRIWWGAVRWRTGMTTLTLTGYAASFGSATIKVYLNGSGTAAATNTPSASCSGTVRIASGYSDGDIILIELRTFGNTTKTSLYTVRDIYTSPVVVSSSWPGVPTFAGTYDSTRLNQLINACQNLYDRIAAVPIPATMGHFWASATHKVDTVVLYLGSVCRFISNDILRVIGQSTIFNDAEHLEIFLNGALVHTSSTWGINTTNSIYVPISLASVTLGARADVEIHAVVTDATTNAALFANGEMELNSRYSLLVLRSEADGSGYAAATPPTEFAGDTSISAATLNSRLNAIATILNNVKTRLDANSVLWDRARAVRRRYAQDEHEYTKLGQVYTPIFQRFGDTLVVRGKNVSIGWAARIIDPQDDAWREYKYHYAQSQSVISGDKVDTQIVSLDAFPGLVQGAVYSLSGDIHYASEVM
jgi:hypothetical protein